MEVTSKLHDFVKNQDKLLSSSDEMLKLEFFVQNLEKFAKGGSSFDAEPEKNTGAKVYGNKNGNEVTNSHIIAKMRHQMNTQQEEIDRLEKDKNALLDEIFKCKTGGLNVSSGFFE